MPNIDFAIKKVLYEII